MIKFTLRDIKSYMTYKTEQLCILIYPLDKHGELIVTF